MDVPPGTHHCFQQNGRAPGWLNHCRDDLQELDFIPSNNTGVVYLTEGDVIASSTYTRKLAKLRKANKMCVVVLAERTTTSGQYYSALQKYCMLDLGFTLIPVPSHREAGSLLSQMVQQQGQGDSNPFIKRRRSMLQDQSVLETLHCIPTLGEVKVKLLLENFGSIKNICEASADELAKVIGRAGSVHVKQFLCGEVT